MTKPANVLTFLVKIQVWPAPDQILAVRGKYHNSIRINKMQSIQATCGTELATERGMERNANRKPDNRTQSRALLARAILLEVEKITETQERDRELREKVAELAKTSFNLYQQLGSKSEVNADTPQLAKKCEELAKAIRSAWGDEGSQMIEVPPVRVRDSFH
ncbi:MAG: hypothetical protein O6826_07885 [Acidobacteria bacterium]|nr:hypothetical protein [Acidobacteriota bacterium]